MGLTISRARRGLDVLRRDEGPLSVLVTVGSDSDQLLSPAQACTSAVCLPSVVLRAVVAAVARDTYVASGASVCVLVLRAGSATVAVLSLLRVLDRARMQQQQSWRCY